MASQTATIPAHRSRVHRPPAIGSPPGVATPVSRRPTAHRPLGELVGLLTLLSLTAGAYLWNLTASGNANSFYAAAVQAGARSWKAFFFGSLDSSNFITVDKPPASLWVMELSARIFGFSSASMLGPQVLEGVATVALVYAMVRRWYGHRFGMLAGAVVATTPAAALMFRFNNPDALLVLLLTAAAYAVTRALERGSSRWLAAAGAAVGFAFLSKMGQALLVVPGLAAAYLVAAPVSLRRRAVQLLAAGAAMVAAAGWWVLIVTLWPASSRPMIDGSSNNSIWNLIVGYNGLERVISSSSGGPGGSFSGVTGPLRLFNSLMGGQASWLLPAALVALVAGGLVTLRRERTDRTRAVLIMWGGWLLVTALIFSYGQGVIHTYYTVALAPAIGALVGIGAAVASQHWHRTVSRLAVAAVVALTGWWAWDLLDRTPSWHPWLRTAVVVASALSAVGLVVSSWRGNMPLRKLIVTGALGLGMAAGLAGPTAYSLQTIDSSHTGSIPSAGPSTGSGNGLGGGGGPTGGSSSRSFQAGGPPSGSSSFRPSGSGEGFPGGAGGPGGSTGSNGPTTSTGSVGGGGAGGGVQTSAALLKALEADSSHYRWVAATSGSQSAASLELATGGKAVMAIGGFSGTGGNITLAQFEKYVAAGDIHYYIASGGSGGPGGSSSSSAITSWVESHFKSETIGSVTVYDLTSPTTSSTGS